MLSARFIDSAFRVNSENIVSFYLRRHLLRLDSETVFFVLISSFLRERVQFMSDLGMELMRGVVVGISRRLDEVGQRLG